MSWQCDHKTSQDHKDGNGWRCSVCGRIGAWSSSWGYYGNHECKRCWEAQIDAVYCSSNCQDALVASGLGWSEVAP